MEAHTASEIEQKQTACYISDALWVIAKQRKLNDSVPRLSDLLNKRVEATDTRTGKQILEDTKKLFLRGKGGGNA